MTRLPLFLRRAALLVPPPPVQKRWLLKQQHGGAIVKKFPSSSSAAAAAAPCSTQQRQISITTTTTTRSSSLSRCRHERLQQQRQRQRWIRQNGGSSAAARSFSSPSPSQPDDSRNNKSKSSSNLPMLLDGYSLDHPECNAGENVASKVGMNLHRRPNHPLNILTRKIADYFEDCDGSDGEDHFVLYDDLSPVVTTQQNFDSLRIPEDHVSRSKSDTYYLDKDTVLRTHTSAHQVDILSDPENNRFLVAGDVYRRDEIDRSHYPVFHQMEGVKVFSSSEDFGSSSDANLLSRKAKLEVVENDLKSTLEGLADHLFGSDCDRRWVDEYFPFTHPSFELEIEFEGEWMEVLGCGVVHPDILRNANRNPDEEVGWAFGLGLERLAMVLFDVPDIRLFWTDDERFHSQFKSGEVVKFQPYSKYPPCFKDVSFWLPQSSGGNGDGGISSDGDASAFHVNDLNEILRDVGGDLIERVWLIDQFTHPKTNRESHCYRISYRSMDRSLTNDEIDELQEAVRERIAADLGGELR